MEIELYSLLSTVIVLVFLFTVIFAIYCYIAFRVRQRASLRHSSINSPAPTALALEEPKFFKPLYPKQLK
jgi:hypothetical protein